MGTQEDVVKIEHELILVKRVLHKLNTALSENQQLIQTYTYRVQQVENLYGVSIKPEFDALKSLLNPLQSQFASMSIELEKFSMRFAQWTEYVDRVEDKQAGFETKVDNMREIISEFKSIFTAIQGASERLKTDLDTLQTRISTLEKNEDMLRSRVDKIYQVKSVIFTTAVAISGVVTFLILIKDYLIFK